MACKRNDRSLSLGDVHVRFARNVVGIVCILNFKSAPANVSK